MSAVYLDGSLSGDTEGASDSKQDRQVALVQPTALLTSRTQLRLSPGRREMGWEWQLRGRADTGGKEAQRVSSTNCQGSDSHTCGDIRSPWRVCQNTDGWAPNPWSF